MGAIKSYARIGVYFLKYSGRLSPVFIAMLAGLSMTAVAHSAPKRAAKSSWLTTVAVSEEGGHVVGNPNAPIKVVEYASYTCSHCARFETNDAPVLRSEYIAKGSVSLEVRPFILNAFDLPLSLLAQCGAPRRYAGNHRAILSSQSTWLVKLQDIGDETKAKLEKNDIVGFNTDVYNALNLKVIANQRGLSDAVVQKCMGDMTKIQGLVEITDKATNILKVEATPSFLVNGELKKDVHNFSELKPFLDTKPN
jgi:protein-disulfide isomerase